MDPLDDVFLSTILCADANGKLQPENVLIEYKEIFDRDGKEAKAKYLKELAALHNHKGGYLIFGVRDDGLVVGLDNFDQPDNATLSNDINYYFSPAFIFSAKTFQTGNYLLYIIHVEARNGIPTVCTENLTGVLKSGTIYWRYPAKSAPIEAGDLIHLLHSLRGEETAKRTALEEAKFKHENKPYLALEGGMTTLGITKPKLKNNGKRAHLSAINVLDGDVRCFPYSTLPRVIDENQKMPFEVQTTDGRMMNTVKYKLEFIYTDELGTKYRAIGEFTGGSPKMSEAEEIT